MTREIQVDADWLSLSIPSSIGSLSIEVVRGKETYSFSYDSNWLDSDEARNLDPDLQWFAGRQFPSAKKHQGFGIFLDSAPDRWGRVLMQRREAHLARIAKRQPKKLMESDFLIGVHDEQPPLERLMQMTDYNTRIIEDIETHSAEAIRECFQNGVSPNSTFRNEPLLHELTSEYGRGPSFRQCVKAFVDNGLRYDNAPLLAVLLDDADALHRLIEVTPSLVSERLTLRCAYTPLTESTLLHVCAEYNHVDCANVLIANGANVNALAGVDEVGFGGQSPIFHTVNQNQNQSQEMMELLLHHGADLSITVHGIVWGQSYPWETLIPSVNPISYAMMGLLPQMHRDETTISQIVRKLMKHRYGICCELKNIPNAYLRG